jgi:hypothetical protein
MSKLVWRAILIGVIAFGGVAASGSSGAAVSNGANIKGVGGGWIGFPPFTSSKYAQFSFSAHEGPNGDFGQSHLTINEELAPLDVSVDVDCVNVFPLLGLRGGAWFSGPVTKVNDPNDAYAISPGDRLLFIVNDGGEPSVAPVDGYNVTFDIGDPCKDLPPTVEPPDVTHGNIVIDPN